MIIPSKRLQKIATTIPMMTRMPPRDMPPTQNLPRSMLRSVPASRHPIAARRRSLRHRLFPQPSGFEGLRKGQVVLTTRTEHEALCVTVFGTLPSTRRCMPLLPTTRRSASHSIASCTSTSAGSPSSERVVRRAARDPVNLARRGAGSLSRDAGRVLEGAKEYELGVESPRQVGRHPDRLERRRRAVSPNSDRREHHGANPIPAATSATPAARRLRGLRPRFGKRPTRRPSCWRQPQ